MTSLARQYSLFDQMIMGIDTILQTLFQAPQAQRPNPAKDMPHCQLPPQQSKEIGRLMRINHTGEVCAQALYLGQAMVSRDETTKNRLQQSAQEEMDHLAWCQDRIKELNTHTSYLNPLWYVGSLTIGMMAGVAGDGYNLGFVVETERQVENHLQKHLDRLPLADTKSRAILEQMQRDEKHHANAALEQGARELPSFIKAIMKITSKVMTTTTYWI